MITAAKTCTSCGKNLHGRSDKKFCNDYCRNAHNNRINSDGNNYMRTIDHRLRKNRRILQSLLNTKLVARMQLGKLHSKGFAFAYCTHTHTNRKGNLYRFCYEYGYMLVNNDQVLIMQQKQDD